MLLHPGVLRGKVAVGVVGVATGVGAARTAPLIALSVQGKIGKRTEDAANALARIVVADTTAPYVGTKIATYESVLATTKKQLTSIRGLDRTAETVKKIPPALKGHDEENS